MIEPYKVLYKVHALDIYTPRKFWDNINSRTSFKIPNGKEFFLKSKKFEFYNTDCGVSYKVGDMVDLVERINNINNGNKLLAEIVKEGENAVNLNERISRINNGNEIRVEVVKEGEHLSVDIYLHAAYVRRGLTNKEIAELGNLMLQRK